jgi:hypothetical protein
MSTSFSPHRATGRSSFPWAKACGFAPESQPLPHPDHALRPSTDEDTFAGVTKLKDWPGAKGLVPPHPLCRLARLRIGPNRADGSDQRLDILLREE